MPAFFVCATHSRQAGGPMYVGNWCCVLVGCRMSIDYGDSSENTGQVQYIRKDGGYGMNG